MQPRRRFRFCQLPEWTGFGTDPRDSGPSLRPRNLNPRLPRSMKTSTKDKIKGTAKQAAGKTKVAAGKVTGSARLKAKGAAQAAEGKAQKAAGSVKRARGR